LTLRKAPAELPPRYSEVFDAAFRAEIAEGLVGARAVLDVGGGRTPTLTAAQRPAGVHYVGLDLSGRELALAGPGAYDERIEADLTRWLPREGAYDLVVSWQVLEHVRDLEAALANIRRCLRPGGRFVAMLSGRWSFVALGNRLIPDPVGSRLVAWLMDRPGDTVFAAHYDAAYQTRLLQLLGGWRDRSVIPYWRAGEYLQRAPWLQHMYLLYEDWALRTERNDLATHYLVVATR